MNICGFYRKKFISVYIFLLLVWPSVASAVSCSESAIESAIASASAGAIIDVSSGTCTINININKEITLRGGQSGATTLSGSNIGIASSNVRITGFNFTNCGETITISGVYGVVIDNNTFATSSSSAEIIKIYGPNNSWSTVSSIGGANNVFIEDNTFSGAGGSGQAAQGNYNARVVFRYNTVSAMKFDMHGIWSNGSSRNYLNWTTYTDAGYTSDAHSARHCEVYNNTFTDINPWGMELRGGTGVVYNNTIATTGGGSSIVIRDYCTSVGADGNCARCMCPADYPLRDQIGRGVNQTLDPMYFWNNTGDGGAITGYSNDGIIPRFLTFEGQPSSSCVSACGGASPGYGLDAGTTWSDCSAIIKQNRDYYMSQKSGYTAYTYPHPLRSGNSPEAPPSPPQGFKIVP